LEFAVRTFDLLVQSVLNNFSFPVLLKSLFSPWKRMIIEDDSPGFNIQRFFENLTFNVISRSIGFIARLILIVTGIIATIFITLTGIIFVLLWIVFPPIGLLHYLKYSQKHDSFLKALTNRLSGSSDKQVSILFDNEAGRFTARHLGLEVSTFVTNAKLQKESLKFGVVECYSDLIKKFVEADTWSDDFLRSKGVSKENLIFGAAWWDRNKKNATEIDESVFYRRPGVGLGLLYGYTPNLNQYTVDLSTPQSFSNHLIGREKAVQTIERVLSSGNSVALTGHPGVGKRTVVLEFARRAIFGQLGPEMSYRRILEFDYNSLLAGSEDINSKKTKLAAVLNEAAYAGNIILVIRDIHRITNVQVEGFDFTDVFETLMEKRELKIIAIIATTDYERFVAPNMRLRKFLEKVEVVAPTKDEALLIIRDAASNWEQKLPITIMVQSVKRILDGSDRFVTDIPFPEKALELLDEAVEYDKKNGDRVISEDDVNEVLSEKTGISFARLTEKEKGLLTNLEEVIHEGLINQESAVSQIARSLRARTVGVSKEDRPLGSFLFLGPTGVGKTETAKVLAKIYYGSEEAMIRFDMAQYSSPDALERLIGSVASGRPGDLSTAIRNRPASLLLLDEIEKAGKDVHNLLLTMLDEGYLIDAFGKKISCVHLFIIGTSNAAAEYIRELVNKGITGEDLQGKVVEFTLKKGLFYPEFLNRFDGVVVYSPLTVEHLEKIAGLMLASLAKNLKLKGIVMDYPEETIKKLAQDGFDPAFGARPMRRLVDLVLGDLLGRAILSGEVKEGDSIKLLPDLRKGEFKWEKYNP
jgi:ATP-dependent Clp protease ATP-binding subunit ClpC